MNLERIRELAGINSHDDARIVEALDLLEKEYQGKYNLNIDTGSESVSDIQNRMEAATRALGLANRLSDPKKKKEHLSRILSNMNTIRAALQHAINDLIKQHPELLSSR